MSTQRLSDLDFNNVARILNLPDATQDQQPATYAQLKAISEGFAWKDDVRAASTANVNLATPGTTLDGVTLVTNDRILLKDQTDQKENGVYIYNGASTLLTRALDANSTTDLNSAVVPVNEGTSNTGTSWRQSTTSPVVGTSNIVFGPYAVNTPDASTTVKGKIQIATQVEADAGTDALKAITPNTLANYSGRAKRFSANVGDGSATSITINHNLNTYDVAVELYRNSGSRDTVLCDVQRPTVNSVTFVFAAAPALNAFRAIVVA